MADIDHSQNAEQQEGAGDSVPVTFFTTTMPRGEIPEDQTYAVPLSTLPQGLSSLVNQLLGNNSSEDSQIPLDFLVGDNYISTSLEKFMRRRGFTVEDSLRIEYTPAMQIQEGSKLPHDDWVSSVVGPQHGNPSILFTGAYDHAVRLWSGEECLAIGTGHTAAVKEVRLHPIRPTNVQSSTAAAATENGAPPRKVGRKSKRDHSGVESFHGVSVGKDCSLNTWLYNANDSKFELLSTTLQHGDSVDTVDVHASGDWVATGSWDTTSKLFRWSDLLNPPAALVTASTIASKGPAPTYSFSDHSRAILKVRFSPTYSHRLYTTGLDGSIKLWDIEKGQMTATMEGDHAAYCLSVAPASQGQDQDWILVGCSDNRLRLFDSRAKKAVKTWSGHRQWVYGVAWQHHTHQDENAGNKSNPLLVSGSEDSTVRVWDMRSTTSALVTMDLLHTDGVLDVTYIGNNEVASCGKDNRTKTLTLKQPIPDTVTAE